MKTVTVTVADSAVLPKIRIENGWLLIEVRFPYHIDLKRMNEPWKLERWIEHLEKKPWMNATHLATVVELVSGYCKPKKGPWIDKTAPPFPHYMP